MAQVAEGGHELRRVLDEDREVDGLGEQELLELYRSMVLLRTYDERSVVYHRQGRIGTYAIFWNHEAMQAGAVHALEDDDWIFPSYRESAIGLLRGMPAATVLSWWRGHPAGWWNPADYNVASICVPIGTHVPHAAGLAWGKKLRGEPACAIVFFGDGATSEGAFHEGANFAAVMNAPLILFCNNNQWAISTPLSAQRGRDRPLVVVAKQDQRRIHHRSEVRAFVKRALRGRAVAEEHDCAGRLPAQLLSPSKPGSVRDVRPDRDADRGDIVVRRVPPARGMAAPPREHRRRRHPAQQADRRLAVARKDPVVVLECMDGACLHRLVVPEDGVGPDASLPVIDHRTLVVCAQQDQRAVEVEQLALTQAGDLAIRRRLVADHATEVALRGKNLGHCRESIRAGPRRRTRRLNEDGQRLAFRCEDGVLDIAEVLPVCLQRQRSITN